MTLYMLRNTCMMVFLPQTFSFRHLCILLQESLDFAEPSSGEVDSLMMALSHRVAS